MGLNLKKIGKNIIKTVAKAGKDVGAEAKRVGKKKVLGVSIAGGLSSLNPLLLARHAIKNPDTFASDLKAGVGNAANIMPVIGKFGGGTVGDGGDGGYDAPLGEGLIDAGDGPAVTGRDAYGNKVYDTGRGAVDAVGAGSRDAPRYRGLSDFLTDPDNLLGLAGAAGDAYMEYQDEKRRGELYGRDKRAWEANAGLRDAGRAGMLNSVRPDNSALFAEPTARYRRVNVGSR